MTGCTALPTAARRWKREDASCASSAKTVVLFGGNEHAVCYLHAAAWKRAEDKGTQRGLAASWRWE